MNTLLKAVDQETSRRKNADKRDCTAPGNRRA